uniref:LIM/homeobox protein Lhx9 n=1 Tax=Oreochromis aureus TaxID=47969 RepID=A0A668TEP7_OREAU
MTCAGCGEQVLDRFFLLAAGRVWHNPCLRCSQCQCELQTHPSLYWRDGNIYCQQDYCRSARSRGQCARCFQPIPASDLVMRSGELTFHPHCFSCQVSLEALSYYFQGANLYCQSHYQSDGGVQTPPDLQPKHHLDGECEELLGPLCASYLFYLFILSESFVLLCWLGPNSAQVSGEGEESVSSPEPRSDDRGAGGRIPRRTKRIRTCFRSEQLRALESYFAQKHNPDGKDWTCLAHKTGLPKRVLQLPPWQPVPHPRPAPRRTGRSLFPPAPSTSCSCPCSPPRSASRSSATPPRSCCKAPTSSQTTTPRVHRGACPPWRSTVTLGRQEVEKLTLMLLVHITVSQ